MSISPRNLWPEEIDVSDVIAPVSILKEQASLLGERTKNLVEGRVMQSGPEIFATNKAQFSYNFDLIAPALNNYRYRLFRIEHDVELYPLFIRDCEAFADKELEVLNEEQLLARLGDIFSSEKTLAVIKSLIAQSRA